MINIENLNKKLTPPCSYQGGKQRLAKQIVDIIFEQNEIKESTKFYDLCCGSGAITLELINRGIYPQNITMIDNGVFGMFWKSIADNRFNINIFKQEIDKLPEVHNIQKYLKDLNNNIVVNKIIYHYLLLQSGSFGSKQICLKENKWKNNSFRNYWKPTEKSNRKSPVNPMMPMPDTLFNRVKDIVECLSGSINAINIDIENIKFNFNKNMIVYIDPPYKNMSGYTSSFNYEKFIINNKDFTNIYISESYEMDSATNSILLSKGRTKGNINGKVKKKPVEEWLNIF